MKFSLLSYNLLYNRAHHNLDKVLSSIKPDILCVQEISTAEANLKHVEQYGYKLADYSNSFVKKDLILGVATFYNPKAFSFTDSRSFDLPRSVYEFMRFVVSNNLSRRTVLKTEFSTKKGGKRVTIYNLHLPPFATNNVRDKQIKNTFEEMQLAKKTAPVVISGDFNYPYGRRKFEQMIHKYKLQEATNNIFYTLETRILRVLSIKLKLDYILYKNIAHISTEKVQMRHSDHFPILSWFSL